MNNKQNNINRSLLDTSRTGINSQYQDYIGSQTRRLGIDQKNADDLYGDIRSKYTNNNNFLPTGLSPNASGWFDLPGEATGGFGPGSIGADYSAAKAGYGKFAETGGIDRNDFNPALDSYKNFINNGGIGASDADALRARATSQVPAFYNAYKNALSRRANVQGGYAPGFDSQMAEIGRQSAKEGFNASRAVEADILDRTLEGKKFGTAGFGNLMSDITGKEQTGKLAGLSGLKSIGDSELSASSANAGLAEGRAGRNQAMQQFLMDLYSGGGKTNATGLLNLRNSSDATLGETNRNFMGGLAGLNQNDLQNLALRLGIKDRSWLDLIPGLVNAGGTIASGFGGGGGR